MKCYRNSYTQLLIGYRNVKKKFQKFFGVWVFFGGNTLENDEVMLHKKFSNLSSFITPIVISNRQQKKYAKGKIFFYQAPCGKSNQKSYQMCIYLKHRSHLNEGCKVKKFIHSFIFFQNKQVQTLENPFEDIIQQWKVRRVVIVRIARCIQKCCRRFTLYSECKNNGQFNFFQAIK